MRVLYNQLSGALFYDEDGSGPGGAVQIAVLGNHPAALAASDLLVV